MLNQALTDVTFFYLHPEFKPLCHLAWLLLYELHVRRYRERSASEREECVREFPEPLPDLDAALWRLRIKLAAAVSRLRIARSALRLTDLLPPHLRDERVARGRLLAPLTAWVNKNKVALPIDVVVELRTSLDMCPAELQEAARVELPPDR